MLFWWNGMYAMMFVSFLMLRRTWPKCQSDFRYFINTSIINDLLRHAILVTCCFNLSIALQRRTVVTTVALPYRIHTIATSRLQTKAYFVPVERLLRGKLHIIVSCCSWLVTKKNNNDSTGAPNTTLCRGNSFVSLCTCLYKGPSFSL